MHMPEESKSIIWYDDDGCSVYADMSSVAGTRDEISLLFGVSQMVASENDEIRVKLKERIVLSPLAAKRFSIVLRHALQKYESCSRENTKLDLLLGILRRLDLKYGLERSFKIAHQKINENRFLLGFGKNAIQPEPFEKIRDICRKLDMPVNYLKVLEQQLTDANYIHFGYEASGPSCMYKVYLEFWEKIKSEIQKKDNRPGQALLHLGFKWDASNSKIHALTRYTWHPWISVEEILMRVAQILEPDKHQAPFNAVTDMVKLAADNMPHHDFLYLDVTEEDNPRRSFDINMYRANLQMRRLKPFLETIFRHYGISEDTFSQLYEKIKTRTFGHISGGIDRNGKDFLSIYYGVTEVSIEVRTGVLNNGACLDDADERTGHLQAGKYGGGL
jgi:hypothetical protein